MEPSTSYSKVWVLERMAALIAQSDNPDLPFYNHDGKDFSLREIQEQMVKDTEFGRQEVQMWGMVFQRRQGTWEKGNDGEAGVARSEVG